MNGKRRERIAPEVVKAVEEACWPRIVGWTDKEVMAKHKISRSAITRIVRAARKRLRESMTQYSQSRK